MNEQLLEVYCTWIHSQEDSDFEAFINLGIELYGTQQFSNMLKFFYHFTSADLYDVLTNEAGVYLCPLTARGKSANE